ncbi:MAG TPA: hypothetical protein PKE39_05055, partial [Ignavibacteria bacterium]|nr:hypothetical protein [Ignavibacteria bacterium]HMQ98373.1 hypothetical protein [Ignavibacteria bacterium]
MKAKKNNLLNVRLNFAGHFLLRHCQSQFCDFQGLGMFFAFFDGLRPSLIYLATTWLLKATPPITPTA